MSPPKPADEKSAEPGHRSSTDPVSFVQVLSDELEAIEARRRAWDRALQVADPALSGIAPKERPGAGESPSVGTSESSGTQAIQGSDVAREALGKDLSGLALSGGGIRSATFNLGVIQALSELRLLSRFDYLSTVSGGGYIGSWLSALIHRENAQERPTDEPGGIFRVEERLRTDQPLAPGNRAGDPPEDSAVAFLRRYSNYLTPKVGIFTADTWTVVATYLRNLLLNLLLVVAGLGALLLIPRILVTAEHDLVPLAGWLAEWLPGTVHGIAGIIGALLPALAAALVIGFNFAAMTCTPREDDNTGKLAVESPGFARHLQPRSILLWVVGPLVVSAWLASRAIPSPAPGWLRFVVWTAMAYTCGCLPGLWTAIRWGRRHAEAATPAFRVWREILWTAAVAGACGGGVLALLAKLLARSAVDPWLGLTIGPPAILLWFITLGAFHTGLVGVHMADHMREWLNRLGAWLFILAIVWLALCGAVVFLPVLLAALEGWLGANALGGWIATTIAGLLASRGGAPEGLRGLPRRLLLAIAPYVFILGLVALLAVGVDAATSAMVDGGDSWRKWSTRAHELTEARHDEDEVRAAMRVRGEAVTEPRKPYWQELYRAHYGLLDSPMQVPGAGAVRSLPLLLLALVLLGLGGGLALRFDINEFSMHGFYRNRLVRCFLGASTNGATRRRRRQPFTGFHPGDDVALGDLFPAYQRDRAYRERPAPLHLINTALNLVAGEELAWQERQAAAFVLSPLYCGFEVRQADGDDGANGDTVASSGYRRLRTERGADAFASRPLPLTLGSALAISGAAASPNMGFHSTPALAFLLTVFNVRLGWWLGNPRHGKTWRRSGPRFALAHLFTELTGKTRGRTRYVYLSDGGHFENLGIYELVRRRCRFIVACDGGADPEQNFDDLGNAIRKCRADLGVEIEIDVTPIRRGDGAWSTWHGAIGRIHYPEDERGERTGLLLYIKTSLTGDEPTDVLQYAARHPDFPHQSTADQFFDESQFESYRRLGHHAAEEILSRAVERSRLELPAVRTSARWMPPWVIRLERMWVELRRQWRPPSPGVAAAFTRHAAALDRLFERLRNDETLSFLDSQFYPEWGRLLAGADVEVPLVMPLWLPDDPKSRRNGFYFCHALMQLMENVYVDLDLETEFDHPDNRGWMNLFAHWSWSGMFRVTWAICAATFGQRFQRFCEHRIGLEVGQLTVSTAGTGRLHDGAAVELPEQPLDRESLAKRLKARGTSFLNFLEREQIEVFLAARTTEGGASVQPHEVVQVELAVRGHEETELLRFGIGYAVLDAGGSVLLFRIQDHLRQMGLGRRALRTVLSAFGLPVPSKIRAASQALSATLGALTVASQEADDEALGTAEPAAINVDGIRRFVAAFEGSAVDRFGDLLESVRRELDEEKRLRSVDS